MTRGYTLVETAVVLALLGVLVVLAAPFFTSFYLRASLTDITEQIAQDLRRAQSLAIAGESDAAHGVAFDADGNRWILFVGSEYTEGAEGNEVHAVPPAVDLVGTALAGGTTVVFAERTGTTTNTGTVTLRAVGRTTVISINAAGRVSHARAP